MNPILNSVLVLSATVLALLFMFNPKLVQWKIWRATVTPLASIIGSGFLVLGPILERDYGVYSVAVMAGLCLAAYWIGAAIRYNIIEYDRFAHSSHSSLPTGIRQLETAASWTLVFAYVISVAYYLNLFGAFAVKMTPVGTESSGRLVTSAALVFIGAFGCLRGLAAMERMEEVTVGIKLAVIAGLLVGMVAYAFELALGDGLHHSRPEVSGFHSVAVAFGLIVTVQGFETSRYLVGEYGAKTSIRTMKYAQWIATAIYMIYIVLTTISFASDQVEASETAIIEMAGVVAPLLPAMLLVAALSAQFSAAVADTSGSGGLAEELSRNRIKSNLAFAILATGALAITWLANIYEIIGYASRAFAIYYFIQCLIAMRFSWAQSGHRAILHFTFFSLIALLCLCITLLGIPVE